MLTIHMRASSTNPASEGQQPPPGSLLYDIFRDANSTSLAAHAMAIGPGWTIDSGTLVIENNQCVVGAPNSGGFAHSDSGHSDLAVYGNFRCGGSVCGIGFRMSDASNYWFLQSEFVSQQINLYVVVSGSASVVISVPVSFAATDGELLAVRTLGTTITIFWNGMQIGQAVGQTFNETATKCAITVSSIAPEGFCTTFGATL